MKRVLHIVCVVSLLLLACGCTAPVNETWVGYRVTEDCPADVTAPRPKVGEVEKTAVYYQYIVWYRSLHLPGEAICICLRSSGAVD